MKKQKFLHKFSSERLYTSGIYKCKMMKEETLISFTLYDI